MEEWFISHIQHLTKSQTSVGTSAEKNVEFRKAEVGLWSKTIFCALPERLKVTSDQIQFELLPYKYCDSVW